MTSLLDTMARTAALARLDKLETLVRHQGQTIAQLCSALYHHLQDRHDVHLKTDDGPDTVALQHARRLLDRSNKFAGDIAATVSEDARAKRAGHVPRSERRRDGRA